MKGQLFTTTGFDNVHTTCAFFKKALNIPISVENSKMGLYAAVGSTSD